MKNIEKYQQTTRASKARIILYGVIIFLSLSLVSGIVLTYDAKTGNFNLGNLIRERSTEEKIILYKGDHIVLYDSLGFDISDPVQKQEKIDSALSMEALFYLAQKDGMIVSVEEVKNKLESDRLAAENAENYDEFLAMISGMNMTVEEYWSWSRFGDVTQKIMTIDKLMKQQREKLAEEYKNNAGIDIEIKLEEWRLATVKKILDEDNVIKI